MVSLRTGSIATAVGNPVMCAASTKIIPGTSVTATGSGYSSTRTFSVSGDDIPNTAQVRTISNLVYTTDGLDMMRSRFICVRIEKDMERTVATACL